MRAKKGDHMRNDIFIASSMILASVAALLGIVASVARAVREQPEGA
jgi:hypothetical protein